VLHSVQHVPLLLLPARIGADVAPNRRMKQLHMAQCIVWQKTLLLLLLCRGIDVVRNKIKMFAQKKVTLPPGRHKIVILDEADR
jgi:hypothetical protein